MVINKCEETPALVALPRRVLPGDDVPTARTSTAIAGIKVLQNSDNDDALS